MREVLLDIIKHTGALGFLNEVKIVGTESTTTIESIDEKRTVVLKSKLLKPIPEFIGEFGIAKLSRLKSLLDHPNFKDTGATIEVIHRKRDEIENIGGFKFTDAHGQTASYVAMSADNIPAQPTFGGTNWDIVCEATKAKIQEFASFSSIINDEPLFTARVEDNNLVFYFGNVESSMDNIKMIFENEVTGSLPNNLYWIVGHVMPILKVGAEETPVISISGRGAIKISLTTPFAVYDYYLPAKSR